MLWGRESTARLAADPKARWYKPREKEPFRPGDPGTPEHLERRRELQRYLEDETRKWHYLPWDVPDVEIAEFVHLPDDLVDPWDLDLRLRLIRRLAQRVDTYLARLLWALSNHKLWKDMQFTSFGHYVVERLGMSRRNAQATLDGPLVGDCLPARQVVYSRLVIEATVNSSQLASRHEPLERLVDTRTGSQIEEVHGCPDHSGAAADSSKDPSLEVECWSTLSIGGISIGVNKSAE